MLFNIESGKCKLSLEANNTKEAAEKFFYNFLNSDDLSEIIAVSNENDESQYFSTQKFKKQIPKFSISL